LSDKGKSQTGNAEGILSYQRENLLSQGLSEFNSTLDLSDWSQQHDWGPGTVELAIARDSCRHIYLQHN